MQDPRDLDQRRAEVGAWLEEPGLQHAEALAADCAKPFGLRVGSQRGQGHAAVRGREVDVRVLLDELAEREGALLRRGPRDVVPASRGDEVAEEAPGTGGAESAQVDEDRDNRKAAQPGRDSPTRVADRGAQPSGGNGPPGQQADVV